MRNFLRVSDEHGCLRRGPGAWEVGGRYDRVDVNSNPVFAGTLDSVTCGVNWYLNPNAKVQANYVFTHINKVQPGLTGNFGAFGMRVAFDF